MKPTNGPTSEMIRLPADVVKALRRRATTADITIAEAARQLMLTRNAKHQLGLQEHAEWLHARLLKKRGDLVRMFEDGASDASLVDLAIDALGRMRQAWPEDEFAGEDDVSIGLG